MKKASKEWSMKHPLFVEWYDIGVEHSDCQTRRAGAWSSLLHSSADKALDFGAQGGGSPYNGGIIQDHYPLYTAPIIDISIIQHGARYNIYTDARPYWPPPSVGRDRSRYDQFINCPHNMLLLGPYFFVSVFVIQTPEVDMEFILPLLLTCSLTFQRRNTKIVMARWCLI